MGFLTFESLWKIELALSKLLFTLCLWWTWSKNSLLQEIIREGVLVYNQILQSPSIPFYEKNKKTFAYSCFPIIFRKNQTNTYLFMFSSHFRKNQANSCLFMFSYHFTKEPKKHLPVQVKVSHFNKKNQTITCLFMISYYFTKNQTKTCLFIFSYHFKKEPKKPLPV